VLRLTKKSDFLKKSDFNTSTGIGGIRGFPCGRFVVCPFWFVVVCSGLIYVAMTNEC
jgi:hypothetical protein